MIHRHLGPVVRVAVLALLLGVPAAASAQIAVTQSVSGPTITLSWAAVPGADTYVVQAGAASGNYVYSLPATSTGFSINAPITGTFFMKVNATGSGVSQSSNEFTVTVSSLTVPPVTPANAEAFTYCGGVLLRWGASANASGYLINVSGPISGTIPSAGTQLFASTAPAGSYTYTVTAVGAGGVQSAPSAAVPFTVGGSSNTIPSPVISANVYGTYAMLAWSQVPGASSYSFQGLQNGVLLANSQVPASVTSLQQFLPLANYTLRVSANVSCGSSATAEKNFVVDGAPPPGPRTPNPAPGTVLPLPSYGAGVVNQLASSLRGLLLQSCREQGGNNRWLFEVLKELRKRDTRWGLNWKRGNVGDMSQDIITYNAGPDPDEGARTPYIYIVDTIGGHCGNNPGPNWEDVSAKTIAGGTIGVVTLLPYIQAGYVP